MAGLRDCALAAATALEDASDELGRLDSAAGDGDYGITMALVARNLRAALAGGGDQSTPELLTRMALAAGSVGGASGPLYASGLLAAAATLRQAGDEPVTVELLVRCGESAEKAIMDLGQARPGDKTILDALDPAVRSLRNNSATDLGDALSEAAAAARRGAESTAQMIARAGRARTLGERSLGTEDPGACSLALILEACAMSFRGRPR